MKVRHVALGWIGVVLGASMFAMPSAMAQSKWQKLAQSETVTLYVNPRFMVKDGQYRRTLEMQDLKAPDADGVRSRSYLNEYDCESLFFRISQIKSYSGPGLTGRILFEVMEQGYWQKIQPNSLFAVGYVAACGEGAVTSLNCRWSAHSGVGPAERWSAELGRRQVDPSRWASWS